LNASACLFLYASHADFSRSVIVDSLGADLPAFAGAARLTQTGAIARRVIQQRMNGFFIGVFYSITGYRSRFFTLAIRKLWLIRGATEIPQVLPKREWPSPNGNGCCKIYKIHDMIAHHPQPRRSHATYQSLVQS